MLLEIQAQAYLEATRTRIWILVDTVSNLRIKTLVLGNNEWVLYREENTATQTILQQVREGITQCDV
jgi:hypothetical protein